ncbi:MAG: adenylosuccinate synthase [Candidatus Spyradocola sp.]|jgi:adenylosuccinate synthase
MVRAIVGGNWGDEGKGKITDMLGAQSDVVVRFQGGANAGHTIINEYGRAALHLLPSGVFNPNAVNVIGQGVALDLDKLFRELEAEVLSKGAPYPKLLISDRAHVLMPYHIQFDTLEEMRLADKAYGSTKSGIAPFYSDKVMKKGIQVCEIFHDDLLLSHLQAIAELKNAQLRDIYHIDSRVPRNEDEKKLFSPIDPQEMFDYLVSFRDRLRPLVGDVTSFLHNCIREGKQILLEGQLGSLKDTDNGIYPMVTSSSPLAGFACVGAGIPPYAIQDVITVVKAYSSAVGAGAFVSEILDPVEADELRRRGGDKGEYGATTGRPRRVGWFDAVATRYGCMMQGATEVALTNIDVLGYLPEIPVCAAYELDGRRIDSFPVTPLLEKCKPVFEKLPGWQCDISHIRSYKDLPTNARRYVEYIEEKIGVRISMVSNGPARESILYR